MKLLLSIFALTVTIAADPDAIRSVLAAQEEAWNRGDIEAFMIGYENSPTIAFVGKSGVTRGYTAVLSSYRQRYGTPAAMGKLRFDLTEVLLLSNDFAKVVGRFQLARSPLGGGDASGYFTLIMKRTEQGWKIIHDHTS